jgi:uncharacterized protein YjbI with pentapeptide repeats
VAACEFRLKSNPEYRCTHPSEGGSVCIFHADKRNWENLVGTEDLEETVYQRLLALLTDWEKNAEVDSFDCRGFRFRSTRFARGLFSKRVDLRHAVFHRDADFSNAVFMRGVDFGHAIFEGKVCFRQSELDGEVSFSSASFGDVADFLDAQLGEGGSVNFRGTHFAAWANFVRSKFRGVSLFGCARFAQGAAFSDAVFEREVEFYGASLAGEVCFTGRNENRCFHGECDFRQLRLEKDAVVIFERVSLSQASLTDSNLEAITFRDVD